MNFKLFIVQCALLSFQCSVLSVHCCLGQEKIRKYTLNEVIDIAEEQSPDAIAARDAFFTSYWYYNNYKAAYLPTLNFDAYPISYPTVYHVISPYANPNGTTTYTQYNSINENGTVSLSKTVGLTGGQLFMNTSLDWMNNFIGNTTSYLSSPISIGFSQPLSSYNWHNWAKRIEPRRFEEAKKRYTEAREDITVKATGLFFNLLICQINIDIAKINLANNDTLYKIAEKRYQFGKIAENELLQIQLGQLNSKNDLENAKISFELNLLSFRQFLCNNDSDKVELIPPTEVHDIEINFQKALAEAKQNRSDVVGYDRRLLEAASNLKNAQAQSHPTANLYVSVGLTQNALSIPEVYSNLVPQQTISLGVHVPILDWGLNKGRIKLAESNQSLVNSVINQQKITFEQGIFIYVMSFNALPNLLNVAAKADTISRKRFEVTKNRYLIGKIGITEVNIALQEQNTARRSYISTLQSYWTTYFTLRRLTLFDFINNERIKYDFSKFDLDIK